MSKKRKLNSESSYSARNKSLKLDVEELYMLREEVKNLKKIIQDKERDARLATREISRLNDIIENYRTTMQQTLVFDRYEVIEGTNRFRCTSCYNEEPQNECDVTGCENMNVCSECYGPWEDDDIIICPECREAQSSSDSGEDTDTLVVLV